MFRKSMMILAGLTVGLTCSLAGAAKKGEGEMVDNPEYKAWKDFKLGATVKVKETNSTGKKTIVTEMTSTLKKVSDDSVLVDVVSVRLGKNNKPETQTKKRKISAKIDKKKLERDEDKMIISGGGDVPKTTKTEGQEELQIGGKKVKCKWMQTLTVLDHHGLHLEMSVKKWTSDEVPGGLVKKERKSGGKGFKGAKDNKGITTEVVEYKDGK